MGPSFYRELDFLPTPISDHHGITFAASVRTQTVGQSKGRWARSWILPLPLREQPELLLVLVCLGSVLVVVIDHNL